ncbi:DNA repair protein XRCC2 [Operophtera brumata]|uniref:DNA repair protein XRCC2 n=1 Tax=Operophtera brumata TaxID=104452 RepID=A0A0L7L777_OPEBR|nr:DNA repair protein XRCC2 [Operophtera brumata]
MSAAKFKIESGVQLLARLTKKPDLENFYPALFQSGPKNGEVIEVFSDSCASHFLIDIISEALIQTRLNGAPAGVLIFNTDGNINYEDLIDVIKKKIFCSMQSSNVCTDSSALENTLKETVANLYVVDIYDVTQFYTTIHKLESILIEYPNISLVIFNTLTAFYWSEQGYKIIKMDLYIKNLINIIQKVIKEYKTILLYTRPDYFCTNKDAYNIPAEVNYQIRLLDNSKGSYQVNVNSTYFKATKFFKIYNKGLKWM